MCKKLNRAKEELAKKECHASLSDDKRTQDLQAEKKHITSELENAQKELANKKPESKDADRKGPKA